MTRPSVRRPDDPSATRLARPSATRPARPSATRPARPSATRLARTVPRRRARAVLGALVALGSLWVAGAGSETPVAAIPTERQTATSSRTGVTYSGIYSCMYERPSVSASNTDRDVFVRLEVIRDGDVVEFSQSRLDRRNDRSLVRFGLEGRTLYDASPGVTFRLSDRFADEDVSTLTQFMEFTPTDCPDYAVSSRSAFSAITPTRVLDTRSGSQVNHTGGQPTARSSVTIPASVMPERPAGTTAVSITLTTAQPAGPGFAQALPTGAPTGGSSTVNTPGFGAVANAAIVPVGPDGSITVFVSQAMHVIVDVNGYFVETTDPVAAGRLESTTPERLFDSRPGERINSDGTKPGDDSTTTVDLTVGDADLPAGATAAIVNITATGTTAPGFVQAAAAGELVPGTSSVLNVLGADQNVAGLAIVPLSEDGRIDVFTKRSSHIVVDLFGWFTGAGADASLSGLFVPLEPERILDSRFDTFINPDTDFTISGACCAATDSHVGVPAIDDRASAVVLNVTGIARTGPAFIQVGARDRKHSNVNTVVGRPVANAAIIPLNQFRPGEIPLRGGGLSQQHGIVDVTGFFTN